MSLLDGDQQEATVGTDLGSPLRVRVTRDGAPVAGVLVNWSSFEGAIRGGGVTGVDGVASAAWTLPLEAGRYVAAAYLGAALSTAAVHFSATANPGAPATLELFADRFIEGDMLRFSATVADAQGNGVPGVVVTWTLRSLDQPGDGESAPAPATNAQGIVTEILPLGTGDTRHGPLVLEARTSAGLAASLPVFRAHFLLYWIYGCLWDCGWPAWAPEGATVQVKAGTEVLWAILTPGHSVEVVGIDGSDSGPLEARMIHTYRFDTPGTYRFRCSIHSTATEDELAGTVIVIP